VNKKEKTTFEFSIGSEAALSVTSRLMTASHLEAELIQGHILEAATTAIWFGPDNSNQLYIRG
jgi:hypothetical protein